MGTSFIFKVFFKDGNNFTNGKKNGIMPNIETDVLDQEAAGN